MTKILDGKALSATIKDEIANEVRQIIATGKRAPHLVAVIVGEDGASQTYVAAKEKASKEVGFTSSVYRLPATISEEELLKTVDFLNKDKDVDGYIIQLPLPKHIDENKIINSIDPEKDVDCFTAINLGRMVLDEEGFLPATPMGVCTLLERYGIETDGKHCVVVGRSNIVGTPMMNLMCRNNKHANCTVTICHSHTKDLAYFTRQADILVVAIGKPEFITADMVKDGAVLVDVGIHRIPDESKPKGYYICGDVKHSEVDEKCSWTTPVPGGTGPLTIITLLQNTLKAYKKQMGL